ncbi:MAG: hypothetical protein Ta2A_16310 [Treponemataceae bacterium]|nr:MAG: hypothetical protein Ta2A_16310 [Treponemataceae bacterium]
MKKNFSKTVFFLFMLIVQNAAFGEQLQVKKMHVVKMESNNESVTTQLEIDDGLFIEIPSFRTFLDGIEITLKIPAEIMNSQESFSYLFYDDILPRPRAATAKYTGTRLLNEQLPQAAGLTITIPYGGAKFERNPYRTIAPFSLTDAQPTVFFKLQSAQGSASKHSAQITVTVKPIIKEKGTLSLKILYPPDKPSLAGKNYSVFIDDKAVETNANEPVFLGTGLHHISVISSFFRNETRTFTIVRAQNTAMEIRLRDASPVLHINAPAGTEIYFDGARLPNINAPFTITATDHVIRVSLGDYETTQILHAINGKTYTMTFAISVEINEEQ